MYPSFKNLELLASIIEFDVSWATCGPILLRKIKFLSPRSGSRLSATGSSLSHARTELPSLQLFRRRSVKSPLLWEATVACRCSASLKPHNVSKNRLAHPGGCWFNIRARPNSRRWKAESLADYRRCTFCEIDPFLTDRRVSRRRGLRGGFYFFSASEPNPKTLTPLKRSPFFKAKRLFFPLLFAVERVRYERVRVVIIEPCRVSWNCRSLVFFFPKFFD